VIDVDFIMCYCENFNLNQHINSKYGKRYEHQQNIYFIRISNKERHHMTHALSIIQNDINHILGESYFLKIMRNFLGYVRTLYFSYLQCHIQIKIMQVIKRVFCVFLWTVINSMNRFIFMNTTLWTFKSKFDNFAPDTKITCNHYICSVFTKLIQEQDHYPCLKLSPKDIRSVALRSF